MDQKTWLWRKRSSEKTIVANDKVDLCLRGTEEVLQNEKEVALEISVKNLNEELASVLCESNAKDELVASHAKMAQEAITGQEKAEEEAVLLKQELDEALQERIAANERLTHLNAALKGYMQQLTSVKEQQDQRIRDAVMKTSKEFEKAHKKLEEKLTETSKRLAMLNVENSHLSKALVVKEKQIEDITKRKSQTEAEFNTLMARLDSTEKENAFLRYEFRMLEKEFEIRNEEIEFSRRSADVLHKQQLESAKKITKLEAECQRLRVLLRKRLPGPAALAKMKSEVEITGRNQTEMRRRKLNSVTGGLVVRDLTIENSPEIPSKKISFLIERLCDMEEENKILKEALAKKDEKLHSSRTTCAITASELSLAEAQPGGLSKGQNHSEMTSSNAVSSELSITSSVEVGNHNEIIPSGSWASALISELEHFRQKEPPTMSEPKMLGVSDMSLMDDFVEMEKLAIVAVDTPLGTYCISSDVSHTLSDSLIKASCEHQSESTSKELVPVVQGDSSEMEQEFQIRDASAGRRGDWLQDVLKLILEQNRVSKRRVDELLEDIRIALLYMIHPSTSKTHQMSLKHPEPEQLPISGYITWKSPNTSPRVNSIRGIPDFGTSVEETNNMHIQSNLCKSIGKIMELIRRIESTCSASKDSDTRDNLSERDQSTLPCKNSTTTADYSVHVFQWKRCELSAVLQQFANTCNDLLDGKDNFEKFAGELSSALGWIITNCITLQDVSSVGNKSKKYLSQDGPQSVSELGSEVNVSECLPLAMTSYQKNFLFEMEKIQSNLQKENKGLNGQLEKMKSLQKDLEARLQSANDKGEALMNQLRQSEQSIGSLQTELESSRELKRMIEDQMENQKLINEDLDTQLTVAKAKLNEVLQKLSSLEVELEDKGHCCEELEATCLELQLQLESITEKEILKDNIDQEEKLFQTGKDITAASAKLAECQETILNLGKQLKALAPPKEAAVFTTITHNKTLSMRLSLRDRLLAEDDVVAENLKSPKTKEIISTAETKRSSVFHSNNCNSLWAPDDKVAPPEAYLGLKHEPSNAAVGPLAIVPSKKRGGGSSFLRKLLLRKKKGSSKRASLLFAA